MNITFIGHSSFVENERIKKDLIDLIYELKAEQIDFYLGGYGSFDAFCYNCCKQYKADHKSARLIFVTPYISESYQKSRLNELKNYYDEILYPEIEKVPPKFSIIHRNRYMIDISDIVMAFVDHAYGGAYKSLEYARKRKKSIVNLTRK